jgi:hypothetical protein
MEKKVYTLHKLVNLKKRIEKEYNCEYSLGLTELIDSYIEIEREKSKDKKKEYDAIYNSNYGYKDVVCDVCGKTYKQTYIYRHKQIHQKV